MVDETPNDGDGGEGEAQQQQQQDPAGGGAPVAVQGTNDKGEATEDWVLPEDLEDGTQQQQQQQAAPSPATPMTAFDYLRTPEGRQAMELYRQMEDGQRAAREAAAATEQEIASLVEKARGSDPDEATKAKTELADKLLEQRERGQALEGLSEEAETQFWQSIWGGLLTREDVPKLSEEEMRGLLEPGEMNAPDYLWHVIDTVAKARHRALVDEAGQQRESEQANANAELAAKHTGKTPGQEPPQGKVGRPGGEPPGPGTHPEGQAIPVEPGQKIDMNRIYENATEYVRSRGAS